MDNYIGRVKLLQNNDWKFMHGDYPEAKAAGYDDEKWYDIGLPHSFGIPYFQENEFYVGYGCYRKLLPIDRTWIGKKLSLEFQGAFQDTEIYINGILAGTHLGGYTAFEIDISPFVISGDNLLFVRLNNNWNPRLAPRAGEHVFNGGLYRDIYLLVTEKIHVSWYGTRITTHDTSSEKATVSMETEIINESGSPADCILVSVGEYKGSEVFRVSSQRWLEPGISFIFRQEKLINQPNLWHPDTPHLYILKSYLYIGADLSDSYETVFGIRWFQFTADKGFFLNGNLYEINGANVHQDHAGWSDAVTHTGIERDIKMIKDCGMNFIRGSHYPHHTFFADECDRQGLLFWSENCFWGTGGPKTEGYWTSSAYPVNREDQKAFEESCIQTLKEMIRTNRNHPSIIAWSMCNEPFFSTNEVMEKARALVEKLVNECHIADPTRPAAVGGVQRGGFDKLGDIAGYNGDGADIFQNPGVPNLVSEYGSYEESNRPGSMEFPEPIPAFPWRSGKALWCAFHHGSILWDMGYLGMIDYFRLPLNLWYLYRENLLGIKSPEPVKEGTPCRIRLRTDRETILIDGTEDAFITAEFINSSGQRVDFPGEIIMCISKGEARFPTGRRFILSTEKNNFFEGLGAIELRTYYAGESIITATSKNFPTERLTIYASGGKSLDERVLNEQMPPPSTASAPIYEGAFDIGVNRPVFASSTSPGGEASHVTNEDSTVPWRAASDNPGEWIMVDLEGSKPAERGEIVFGGISSNPYEVAISVDGKEFEILAISGKDVVNSFLDVTLTGKVFRYLRILFPKSPIPIAKIKIFT